MDCSSPGSSIHGILQARILEWVAISFSRGSSWPRNRTQVSDIAGRCFNLCATRERCLEKLLQECSTWNCRQIGDGQCLKSYQPGNGFAIVSLQNPPELSTAPDPEVGIGWRTEHLQEKHSGSGLNGKNENCSFSGKCEIFHSFSLAIQLASNPAMAINEAWDIPKPSSPVSDTMAPGRWDQIPWLFPFVSSHLLTPDRGALSGACVRVCEN